MLVFIKLGGSLITEKDSPFTAKIDVIKRLGYEILEAKKQNPDLKLLIGHGSGSFGHTTAAQFGTRDGAETPKEWIGFQKVWWAARQLNQIVTEVLIETGLPIISLPVSSSLSANKKQVDNWNQLPIKACLDNNIIPLIYGDVVIDKEIGATIFSTEELFSGLIDQLHPKHILIAGKESGVFKDFPKNTELIPHISSTNFESFFKIVGSSNSVDVTGGMASKVTSMLDAVSKEEGLIIDIFSGEINGNLLKVLQGEKIGTRISNL